MWIPREIGAQRAMRAALAQAGREACPRYATFHRPIALGLPAALPQPGV
ncbi:hypothetical protein ACFONN_11575 [Dyella humi]